MAHDDPFAGQTVNADWAYYLDTSGTYTPTLAGTSGDPNLGDDGVIEGAWHRNGHWIDAFTRFTWDGANVANGSGIIEISLPFPPDTSIMSANTTAFGQTFIVGSGFASPDAVANEMLWCRIVPASASSITGTEAIRLARNNQSGSLNFSLFSGVAGEDIIAKFGYIADPAGLPT